MPYLERLFNQHKTDKGSNGYAGVYECLFHDKRYTVTKLVEIGIGTVIPGAWSSMAGYIDGYRPGASLRAWRDYFPNAMVYGIDVQPDTQFEEHRITTMLSSSTSEADIERVMTMKALRQADIIIDDGSHKLEDQLTTIKVMMKYLRPGGTYIIEDIQDNYPAKEFMALVKGVVGDLPMFVSGINSNICIVTNPQRGSYE